MHLPDNRFITRNYFRQIRAFVNVFMLIPNEWPPSKLSDILLYYWMKAYQNRIGSRSIIFLTDS